MKHVDQKTLKPARKRGQVSIASPPTDLALNILNAMEQGVIVWQPDGICELVGNRTYELLEMSEDQLTRGISRAAFLDFCEARGEYSARTRAEVEAKYATGGAFSFSRKTPKGRVILSNARPSADGGYVVTLSDITEFRRVEASLARAKSQAEAEKARIEARQEELQRLSLVAAHAKDLIIISDATNRIEWANEAFRRQNGLDLEMDLIGKSGRDVLVGPETDRDQLARIDEAIRNRQTITLEMQCYKRNGHSYWMEQEITPVFDDRGAHTHFILVGRDITQRREAELQAEEARRFEHGKRVESRLLAEFNEWLQSSDTLEELFQVVSSFLEKLLPGSSGAVYVYADTRDVLEAACGWPTADDLTHFEPPDCWALRRGRSYYYGHNTVDIPCTHVKDQHGVDTPEQYYCLPIIAHGDTVGLLHVLIPAEFDDGLDTQKLANFCAEQISLAIANVRLREQLRDQSTRDPLTGLYNRRYFLDYARREIGRCQLSNKPASLISLDVDHFKRFNDTFGHDAGDAVLRTLAEILQSMFREIDVPCRLGGEEFIIMLPGASEAQALDRAEALRAEIENAELRYGGETLKITASLGVAVYPEQGLSLQSLMQRADGALYVAKDSGRNCVISGRESMERKAE
ncbi:MAG: diguanylate cyclase [Pikeienuella sp.]